MKKKNVAIPSVTDGDIKKHLVRLSLPMIGGMMAMIVFNLTDTFFVSRLGTQALAAMGFTFPVVMIVTALSTGMAQGAGSILARAIGSNDQLLQKRITTGGLLFSIVIVILVSSLGILTIDPFFRMLGAEGEVLVHVKNYMFIWYIGAIAVILPPVSDSSMRAIGDMMRPFIVMLVCAVINIILDPILIFGLIGVPRMGISGAALATVISRVIGMTTSLSFLHFRHHLIDFRRISLYEIFSTWNEIFKVGFTASIVRLLPQIQIAILTRIAASVGGLTAVAAIAAGSRVEGFAIIISGAVGMALIPLVGQNWGAGRFERVNTVRKFTNKLACAYAVLLFLISFPTAKPIASIFSDDPQVVIRIVWYIRLLFLSSAGMNIFKWTGNSLNAAGRPRWVLIMNIAGISFILLPLMWIGSILSAYSGMIVGLAVGQMLLGFVSVLIGRRELSGGVRGG